MSHRAWIYIWGILISGGVVSGLALLNYPPHPSSWLAFATMAILASIAQLKKADGPNHLAFFATPLFMFAGLLLVEPSLFVLLVAIPHLIEWIKARHDGSEHLQAWYIQPFNIAMHVIAGGTTYRVLAAIDAQPTPMSLPPSLLAMTVAAVSFHVIGQLMLGLALVLARGKTWRQTGVLNAENVFSELIMLCLGMTVAVLWRINPWLIAPALSPLALMYRALMIPQLQQEARTDPKTGLLNARYFNKLAGEELERARRFDRPMAVVMADLDLLRDINNTYGHLAGDIVLRDIGQIINTTVREYDIAGRFGGEEFAIALPEAGSLEARLLAERIRQAIEQAPFEVPTSTTPIHVTMSLGVACFPADGTSLTDLTHAADVAVYQAKLRGRNRVVHAADVPHSVALQEIAETSRAAYGAAFAPKHCVESIAANSASSIAAAEAGAPPAPHASPSGPVTHSHPVVAASQDANIGEAPVAQPRVTSPSRWLYVFVGCVIAAGISVTVGGALGSHSIAPLMIILLSLLAVMAEMFQVSVYGQNTMSVAVVAIFGAAVIGGVPEVAIVSAAVAIAAHVRQGRTLKDAHKVAFNWAVHVLAGAVPALLITIDRAAIDTSYLLVLGLLTIMTAPVYYLVESGLISAAIALSQRSGIIQVWRAQFRWLASHYVVLGLMGLFLGIASTAHGVLGVVVFTLPVVMLRYAQQQYVERTEDSVHELQRMNQQLARANHEVVSASESIQRLNLELRRLNDELFQIVGTILDARDPYVVGHSGQVATYAVAIAREMGLPEDRVEVLRRAGLLHDIGKIAIAEHVLHKPGKLTPEEYEMVKQHVDIGAQLLESSPSLRYLAPFVRHHHERWEGSGYPDGLSGSNIPLEARILNVCDSVEAMASDRAYHRGKTAEDIVAELWRGRGTQFDPAVVDIFVRIWRREGAQFITNSARAVEAHNTRRYDHARTDHESIMTIPQPQVQLARPYAATQYLPAPPLDALR